MKDEALLTARRRSQRSAMRDSGPLYGGGAGDRSSCEKAGLMAYHFPSDPALARCGLLRSLGPVQRQATVSMSSPRGWRANGDEANWKSGTASLSHQISADLQRLNQIPNKRYEYLGPDAQSWPSLTRPARSPRCFGA